MKKITLITLATLLLTSCETLQHFYTSHLMEKHYKKEEQELKKLIEDATKKKEAELSYDDKMDVRVTVYWQKGSGTDKWTARGMTSTGNRAVNRSTAAVDPKIIPYNSRIVIPELNKDLIAHDTGSAVVKRTASKRTGRNEPVVDIFFTYKKEALEFARNQPNVVTAYIIKDGGG
jgi:3D (Asp-Asp-Asp) domain-containing protein